MRKTSRATFPWLFACLMGVSQRDPLNSSFLRLTNLKEGTPANSYNKRTHTHTHANNVRKPLNHLRTTYKTKKLMQPTSKSKTITYKHIQPRPKKQPRPKTRNQPPNQKHKAQTHIENLIQTLDSLTKPIHHKNKTQKTQTRARSREGGESTRVISFTVTVLPAGLARSQASSRPFS